MKLIQKLAYPIIRNDRQSFTSFHGIEETNQYQFPKRCDFRAEASAFCHEFSCSFHSLEFSSSRTRLHLKWLQKFREVWNTVFSSAFMYKSSSRANY